MQTYRILLSADAVYTPVNLADGSMALDIKVGRVPQMMILHADDYGMTPTLEELQNYDDGGLSRNRSNSRGSLSRSEGVPDAPRKAFRRSTRVTADPISGVLLVGDDGRDSDARAASGEDQIAPRRLFRDVSQNSLERNSEREFTQYSPRNRVSGDSMNRLSPRGMSDRRMSDRDHEMSDRRMSDRDHEMSDRDRSLRDQQSFRKISRYNRAMENIDSELTLPLSSRSDSFKSQMRSSVKETSSGKTMINEMAEYKPSSRHTSRLSASTGKLTNDLQRVDTFVPSRNSSSGSTSTSLSSRATAISSDLASGGSPRRMSRALSITKNSNVASDY